MTDEKRPKAPSSHDFDLVRGEVRVLGKRIAAVEERVVPPVPRPAPRPSNVDGRARDLATTAQRHASQIDSELLSVVAAFTKHNELVEGDVAMLKQALAVIARELGAEKKVPPALLATLPPPSPAQRPAPTVKTIATQSRDNSRVASIAAVTAPVALEVARHIPDLLDFLRHVHL